MCGHSGGLAGWRDSLKWVICFAAYQTGREVMASKKLEAFREWFTPKRRRRAGGALLITSIVGPFLYPSEYWVSVMAPGIIFFFGAWPSIVHDKP